MRYPDFLQDGGKIGFVAPAFGCTTEPYSVRFDAAIKRFESMGYEIVEGPNCRLSKGIGKSNSPKKCAEELNDFYINNRSDVIISCGGGELMCEDVPFFDFEGMKNAPAKWYMGYSDNTNFVFLLTTLCDTAAIYGPGAGEFGLSTWHKSIEDAFSLLKGTKLSVNNYDGWENPCSKDTKASLDPYAINEPYRQVLAGKRTDRFSGRLLGGCLDCLATLCGTDFDRVTQFAEKYKNDGIIWFLEACDLNVMSIRRALWQLDNAGWFKNTKGFIIGRPLHYDDTFGDFDCHAAVEGILSKYNVPIVMDIDLGHIPPMMPIISGSTADIYIEENGIRIDMGLN